MSPACQTPAAAEHSPRRRRGHPHQRRGRATGPARARGR